MRNLKRDVPLNVPQLKIARRAAASSCGLSTGKRQDARAVSLPQGKRRVQPRRDRGLARHVSTLSQRPRDIASVPGDWKQDGDF